MGGRDVITFQDGGKREGIARALSQMCTYPFEAKKACLQVYGKNGPAVINCYRGIFQSSLTSGFVFGSYFSIYNHLHPNPFASSVASFITSFMKIPLSNCMRVMQINQEHPNLVESGKKIVRMRGVRGLYNGYSVSLAEDIVETSVRNFVYESGRTMMPIQHPNMGLFTGAFAGALGAAITTPFDTIRANMAQASIKKGSMDLFETTSKLILSKEGPKALFRGVHIRSASNAVRYALFYLIMEYLYLIPF